MATDSSPTTLVFYRQGRGLFAFLCLLVAAWIAILASQSPASPLPYLVFAALWVVWAADAIYRRLTLTSDGLEYRTLLSTTAVPWTDAKAIVPPRRLYRYDSLLVQPSRPSIGPAVSIPLTYFSRSWRSGPLGQFLKAKAPHLFQAADPPQPAA